MKQTKRQPTYLFERLVVYEAGSILWHFKLALLDLLAELPAKVLVTPVITDIDDLAPEAEERTT